VFRGMLVFSEPTDGASYGYLHTSLAGAVRGVLAVPPPHGVTRKTIRRHMSMDRFVLPDRVPSNLLRASCCWVGG